MTAGNAGYRYRAWKLLDWDSGERQSRTAGILIAILIVVNVASAIIGTVKSGAVAGFYDSYRSWFSALETFSLAVFVVEYVARLWASPEGRLPGQTCPDWQLRLRHACGFYNVVDFLAIAPLIFVLIFDSGDVKEIIMLRMFRLLKVARYVKSYDILADVIVKERAALGGAMMMFCIALILAAGGIYIAESGVNPRVDSIPAAMWWAIITLTTIGYGDVVPMTLAGKIFSSIVAIIGIFVVAVNTSIVVSGMQDHYAQKRAKQKEKEEQGIMDAIKENADLSPEQIQSVKKAIESRKNNHP